MWRFGKHKIGTPERDPQEIEFFKIDDNPSIALVREFIQNSIDAKITNSKPVKVKFTLGETSKDLPKEYFGGLIEHLKASELIDTDFKIPKKVSYLTLEDFNTTGLEGDLNNNYDSQSNFYSFWMSEGISEKSGLKAGRWGLGKNVFYLATKLRSFWGFTVRRNDGKSLLLGKSLLKTHWYKSIEDSKSERYDYYGYFRNDKNEPIEEEKKISDFCDLFSISRRKDPGLSLVIPIPNECITKTEIVKAVIINYFFPIIKGKLIVEVFDNMKPTIIDQKSIEQITLESDIDWKKSEWRDKNKKKLLTFVIDIASMPDKEMMKFDPDDIESNGINENLFGEELSSLKAKFIENNLLAFKIPFKVVQKDKKEIKSFYNIFIQKDDDLINKADEFYIRSGIIISKETKLKRRPVRALLNAEDDGIAKFLGDSETPAHTKWKLSTKDFQERYEKPKIKLGFVKNSMYDLIQILDPPLNTMGKNFLKDFFSIKKEAINPKNPGSERIEVPDIDSNPKLYKFLKTPEGFIIKFSELQKKFPIKLKLKIAYDTITGNPFKNYSKFDFNLSEEKIIISIKNGKILSINENYIIFEVINKDFKLETNGFDKKRDIIIDIKEYT